MDRIGPENFFADVPLAAEAARGTREEEAPGTEGPGTAGPGTEGREDANAEEPVGPATEGQADASAGVRTPAAWSP